MVNRITRRTYVNFFYKMLINVSKYPHCISANTLDAGWLALLTNRRSYKHSCREHEYICLDCKLSEIDKRVALDHLAEFMYVAFKSPFLYSSVLMVRIF